MSLSSILNAITHKKTGFKKSKPKYIAQKYMERSITNRLFK